MKFSRDITNEEMSKIAKDPGVVYVLTSASNDHGLVNKHLYRLTPTAVTVEGISVDPNTQEWSFRLHNSKFKNYTIYPTLSDVNEYIKSISKFWEVGAFNEVIGWNMPESVVLASKHDTEQMAYLRLCFKLETPPKEWKAVVTSARRELQFLDKETYEVFEKEIEEFEDRSRKYYM